MTLKEIYNLADNKGFNIWYYPFKALKSMSTPQGDIAMNTDKLGNEAEELCHLAHEIGHIETGSFYKLNADPASIRKAETAANRYAVKLLISKDRLDKLAQNGYVTPLQVAEYFGVTEDFAKKAIRYYGNN